MKLLRKTTPIPAVILIIVVCLCPLASSAAANNTYTFNGVNWHLAADTVTGEMYENQQNWPANTSVVLDSGEAYVYPEIFYNMTLTGFSRVNGNVNTAICVPKDIQWNSHGSLGVGSGPLQFIASNAFKDVVDVTSVNISASILGIRLPCFRGCSNLECIRVCSSVDVSETEISTLEDAARMNSAYLTKDGVLYNADMTKLLKYPEGKTDRFFVVPETVTELAPYCFANTKLVGVQFLGDCPTADPTAFEGSDFMAYRWADTDGWPDPEYGDCGDAEWNGITVCSVPRDGERSIEGETYRYEISDGVLFSYQIREGVAVLVGAGYSWESSIPRMIAGSVTIPIRLGDCPVTVIGWGAFRDCSGLTSISMPDGVTNVEYYAFDGCSSLTSITIPDSLNEIGCGVYRGCSSLTTVSIPNGVTTIDEDAFGGCSGLTSLMIPKNVKSIYENTFRGCSGLESIIVDSNNPVYDSRNNCNAIIKTAANRLIAGCKNTIIPNNVTSIGNYAFDGCSSLMSIAIPSSVTSIGLCAFQDCAGLTSIAFPDSVTSIGSLAFQGCERLASLSIPDSVSSFGSQAFGTCYDLASITIPYALKNNAEDWDLPESCTVIVRDPLPLSISSLSSDTAIAGNSYCEPLVGVGGLQPYTWEIVDEDDWPDWLDQYYFFSWSDAFDNTAGFRGYPQDEDVGTYSVSVRLTDAEGASVERTFTLEVQENPNGAPVVVSLYPDPDDWAGIVRIGEALTFSVAAYDPEGEPLTFEWGLDDVQLAITGPSWIWMPGAGDKGYHRLWFRCSDGERFSEWSDWTFEVVSSNVLRTVVDLPTAVVGTPYSAAFSVSGGTEPYVWGGPEYAMSREANSFAETGVAQEWAEDDGCWSVSLPFSFPFYGETYDTIWISDNGTICLDGAYSEYEFRVSDFKSHALIAPLWADMDGRLQTVFVDELAAGQITVRWATRHWGASDGANIIAFAATLCADGTIRFVYDGPSCYGSVGISAGDGARFMLPDELQDISLGDDEDVIFRPATFAPGVVLSDAGVVSGTPTAAGIYRRPVTVVDDEGASWSGTADFYVIEANAAVTRTTPVPVPHSWLLGHGLGDGTASGYEAAALAAAANGRPVWACYVADLDPTDADDDLVANIEMVDGEPEITILKGERANRVYETQGAPSPGGPWGLRRKDSRFFRVKVGMP